MRFFDQLDAPQPLADIPNTPGFCCRLIGKPGQPAINAVVVKSADGHHSLANSSTGSPVYIQFFAGWRPIAGRVQ